jgi:predicted transcriptional regulator
MRHRIKPEIIWQLLEAANGRTVTKTELTYSAFVSHSQLQKYLVMLVEDGFIEYDSENRVCKTSNKGLEFLRLYNQVAEIVSPVLNLAEPRQM